MREQSARISREHTILYWCIHASYYDIRDDGNKTRSEGVSCVHDHEYKRQFINNKRFRPVMKLSHAQLRTNMNSAL